MSIIGCQGEPPDITGLIAQVCPLCFRSRNILTHRNNIKTTSSLTPLTLIKAAQALPSWPIPVHEKHPTPTIITSLQPQRKTTNLPENVPDSPRHLRLRLLHMANLPLLKTTIPSRKPPRWHSSPSCPYYQRDGHLESTKLPVLYPALEPKFPDVKLMDHRSVWIEEMDRRWEDMWVNEIMPCIKKYKTRKDKDGN